MRRVPAAVHRLATAAALVVLSASAWAGCSPVALGRPDVWRAAATDDALTITFLGHASFEIETPAWRKILKWAIVVALTLGVYQLAGHWSLLVPIGLGALGTTFHFVRCRRNGIDPVRATPARKYYELRGWTWPTA